MTPNAHHTTCAAGGVSHGSVVSVVGNAPSCVPGGRDASREDLQIGVDDAGLYVVLIKQLLHCVLIKQLLIARAVSKRARAPIMPWRATQAKILRVRLASLAASSILHVGLLSSLASSPSSRLVICVSCGGGYIHTEQLASSPSSRLVICVPKH
jgi:hypothetical protein